MNSPTSHPIDAWSSRQQRMAAGKQLRAQIPRSAHAKWKPASTRSNLIDLLELSNQDRLPRFVPLRYGRMLQSPLACLRGSAIMMAEDLASTPTTDLRLQSCGDCHLQNFGWFASPERSLVFDITDFDETRAAPWEWDLKRLVASVAVAARGLHGTKDQQREFATSVAAVYRQCLAQYAQLAPLDMWYVRILGDELHQYVQDLATHKQLSKMIAGARQKTVDNMLPKLIEKKDGRFRFQERPPLIEHPADEPDYLPTLQSVMQQYRNSLPEERRILLDRYRTVDFTYKVVGVGSVGLRCSLALMEDPDGQMLVLQIKEARSSVLERFLGPSVRKHHGRRIVYGQRLLQAASDIFLGWSDGNDGRAYYVRQWRDMKLSATVEQLTLPQLREYAQLCGWALARAHAKAGDAAAISGYLGRSEQFDEALGSFAWSYANQIERDFETLQAAAKSGRITAALTEVPAKSK